MFAQDALCLYQIYCPLLLWASFLESNDNKNMTCSLLSQEAQSWWGGRCLKETEEGGREAEAGGAAKGDFFNILIQLLFWGQHEK